MAIKYLTKRKRNEDVAEELKKAIASDDSKINTEKEAFQNRSSIWRTLQAR